MRGRLRPQNAYFKLGHSLCVVLFHCTLTKRVVTLDCVTIRFSLFPHSPLPPFLLMLHYYVDDQKKEKHPRSEQLGRKLGNGFRYRWLPKPLDARSANGGVRIWPRRRVRPNRRRGKQGGIQSLPFNQCPSPLRAALMEMPGGAKK